MLAARAPLHPLIVWFAAAVLAAAETLPLADGGTTPLLTLASEGISVAVAPELGGKVVSLVGPDGIERLSRSGTPYRRRTMDGDYGSGEFDGLDEIFPTLAASPAAEGVPAIPDHGDAWRLPWRQVDGAGLTLAVDGVVLPYRLTRIITIAGSTVTFAYRLDNIGTTPFPWTYCFHPLFALGQGLQVEMADAQPVRVSVSSDGDFLGAAGSVHPWSALRDGPLADGVAVPDRGRFWKALITAPEERRVRLRWRDGGVITMAWSGAELRHAGIWSTEGAILDGLQHIGIEPAVTLEDRLDQAVTAGTAPVLAAGASATWTVTLTWER